MEENEKKNTGNEYKKVEKVKLSPAATVLLTIVATLGLIVLLRILYFFIMGA